MSRRLVGVEDLDVPSISSWVFSLSVRLLEPEGRRSLYCSQWFLHWSIGKGSDFSSLCRDSDLPDSLVILLKGLFPVTTDFLSPSRHFCPLRARLVVWEEVVRHKKGILSTLLTPTLCTLLNDFVVGRVVYRL